MCSCIPVSLFLYNVYMSVYLLTLNSLSVSHCVIVSAPVCASVSISVFTNQYVLHDPLPVLLLCYNHKTLNTTTRSDMPYLGNRPTVCPSGKRLKETTSRRDGGRDQGNMSHWVSGQCLCGGCRLQRLTSLLPSSPLSPKTILHPTTCYSRPIGLSHPSKSQ